MTRYYNLDAVISVGYRVKSLNGTKFRRWANSFLIIDDVVYLFGASLKDAGKKLFAYIRMQETSPTELLSNIRWQLSPIFLYLATIFTRLAAALSQLSEAVATSRRRIRSFLWNLAKIAVPLHRQSEQTTSERHDKNIKFNNLKFIRLWHRRMKWAHALCQWKS